MEAQGQSCADDRRRKIIVRKNRLVALILLLFVFVGTAFAAQDQQIRQKLATLEKIPGKFSFVVIGDNRSGDDI